MQKIKTILKQPLVIRCTWGVAILLVTFLLVRPQVSALTAVRVMYKGCVPVFSRQLATKPGQKLTFRVTTQSTGTLIIEKAGLRQAVAAHRPTFVSVHLPPETGWYELRLEHCAFTAYAAVLDNKGQVPSTGLIRGSHHSPEGTPAPKHPAH